ncbi:arylsulfatase [Penicillium argentinense]|uniref:Arylsulfatase n=1 Tax=Penicillium argentinense TaxID=1131581 RepID=A0A9W9G4H4_9EURO|nr:arylsulfatase [Penicillium argentinense]KAJ5111112.1 arylsulfatase [Penicillium argentinense]
MVDGIFSHLEGLSLLNNIYIVYSRKSYGFEEDINIPLIICGPRVRENATTDIVTTHTDLAPTFFRLLRIPLQSDFDG